MLLELKENILKNVPHIVCKKVNFDNGNRKKTDRVHKSCDKKTDRINKNSHKKTKDNNMIFNGK